MKPSLADNSGNAAARVTGCVASALCTISHNSLDNTARRCALGREGLYILSAAGLLLSLLPVMVEKLG